MNRDHTAQIPTAIAEYFAQHPAVQAGPGELPHPTIAEEFVPGVGWRRVRFNKRVTVSWCRKIAREMGVTGISVTVPGTRIRADFSVREVTRRR